MRLTVRSAGLVLLGLVIAIVAVVIPVGALRAHGTDAFNRWAGWATIAALPVLAASVILLLWDKITEQRTGATIDTARAADELAQIVLSQSAELRSRLIGAGGHGDEAANVRFARSAGRFRQVGGAGEGDLSSVLQYFLSLSPRRLVVLGEAGAGKTVLVLELIVRHLENRGPNSGESVPVLVSAAAFDSTLSWPQWLARHLAVRFSLGELVTAALIRDGLILPVVDGLDEVGRGTDRWAARALVVALNAAMRGRDRAPVVVTSRAVEYEALDGGIDRATHVRMLSLSGTEAADYLVGQFRSEDEQQRWSHVLTAIRADQDGALASQLATPWRLTLALAAFRDNGDPMTLAPMTSPSGVLEDHYSRRVDTLLLDEYVAAAVHLHSQVGKYTVQQVSTWLTALADGLGWQSRHGLSAIDIQLDQWWRPTGQKLTTITHMCLVAVPGLIALLIAATTGDLGALMVGAGFAVFVPMTGKPQPAHRLKLRKITTRGSRRLAAAGIVAALVGGLSLGFAVRLAGGAGAWFGAGGGGALGVGLILGFEAFEDTFPQAVRPRGMIRADGRYGLAYGLLVGLAFGIWGGFLGVGPVGFGVGLGLAIGLAFGLVLGLAVGLAIFSSAWMRYHIAVSANAIRGRGPLQFGEFLDWAQDAGLLRISGVSYQFRHRELQDLFATRPKPG